MKEYIERSKVLELETFMQDADGFDTSCVLSADIRRCPAADVVEVVRCKDCKYYKPPKQSAHWEHKVPYCCRVTTVKVQQDGFCSYGERRSDDD